ncbi:uncharacterized protein ACNLHF_010970 [Anomaloglossus baeobatrachus]|uniref:uncharacterized protein LOC142291385 n=1 Tax=Anomaloglossus baeobatrachus TaxID=238106 RepID=UPI003F4F76F2
MWSTAGEMEVSVRLTKKEKGVFIGIQINGIQICKTAQDEVKNPSSSEIFLTNPRTPQPKKKKNGRNKRKRRTKDVVIEQCNEQIEATMDQNSEGADVINESPTKTEVVVPVRLSTEEEGSEKVVMESSTEQVKTTMEQNNEQLDVIKDPPIETEVDVPVRLSIEEEGTFIDIKIKGIQHFDATHPSVNNPSPFKEILTNPFGHQSTKKKKKKKRRTKKVLINPSAQQVEAKLSENNDQVEVIKKELDVPVLLSTEEKGVFIDIKKKESQSCNTASNPKEKTSISKETLISPPGPVPAKKKKKKKKRKTKEVDLEPPDEQVEDIKDPSSKTVWLNMFKGVPRGLFLFLAMCYYFETSFFTVTGVIFYGLHRFFTYIKTLQDLYKYCEMIYKFRKVTLFPKKGRRALTTV